MLYQLNVPAKIILSNEDHGRHTLTRRRVTTSSSDSDWTAVAMRILRRAGSS